MILRGLYETTYLRDVIERNHLRNPEGMKELVRVIASGIVKDSFLIEEALRYDVNGRKYIGTETKYNFADIGIRAAILNYRQ